MELRPGLRRLLAPNPSPMTFQGTNTYIVGAGRVAVIDPGPDMDAHLAAILEILRPDEIVSHILVTHSHLDHSPLSRKLADVTGAPILAFGASDAGRSKVMQELAVTGKLGGGEGVDRNFAPDRTLTDGEKVNGEGWTITAHHTPGHMANHLSFSWRDCLFSGDHVMAESSTMVSPPDGDLGAFMRSCDRLLSHPANAYFPGHGDPIADPKGRLRWLIDHRKGREAQIMDALLTGPATPASLTRTIYNDIDPALLGAASRNVLAHLIDLAERGVVRVDGALSETAEFRLQT